MTTTSDRLTNRQLFELCKKEFTLMQMEDKVYDHIFKMFQRLESEAPDQEYTAADALDHWAVMYTLNYNAPQS